MSSPAKITDASLERMISFLLRLGVLTSGIVVLAGGIYYVALHHDEVVHYQTFISQPSIDRIVSQIVYGAVHGRARSIIQLGVLLLIATPIARVALSLVGFVLERDRKYQIITAVVLAVLLFSLVHGAVTG